MGQDRKKHPESERKMAERGGFEPPESCPSSVFKTDALNRSTISPRARVPFSGKTGCKGKIRYSKKGKNQGLCGKNEEISRKET